MRTISRSSRLSVHARLMLLPVLVLAALGSPQAALAVASCYVDAAATGSDNGSSWTDAYDHLDEALINLSCTEIWVAAGVYVPGPSEGHTFQVQPGMQVYGGFNGTEALLAERDPKVNLTILSGDIGGDDLDTNGDGVIMTYADIVDLNTDHVVTFDGTATDVTDSTVLDGFIITAGQADGGFGDDNGAGLVCQGGGVGSICSPSLNRIIFIGNSAVGFGGVMYNSGGSGGVSSPIVSDSAFLNNHAGSLGGAVYNHGSSGTSNPTFLRVLFEGNHAGSGAGVMFNNALNGASSPVLVNVTFFGNVSDTNAGAINNVGNNGTSNPTLTNVTFAQNQAGVNGGALYNSASGSGTANPELTNVILWGNTAVGSGEQIYNSGGVPVINYSIVEGGDGGTGGGTGLNAWSIGTGNRDDTPILADLADNGGYSRTMALGWRSPAINTGDNGLCPADDQRGRDRPQGPTCDIGAFEFYPCYVDDSAVGANNGSTWEDAYTDLQDALPSAQCSAVWVAGGEYTPGVSESDAFDIPAGMALYGGFAGTEGLVGDRVPGLHVSALSGDIGDDDTKDVNGVVLDHMDIVGANSDNVLRMDGTGTPVTSSTLLDGFTITAGQADGGTYPASSGAGLYCDGGAGGQCSPSLRNLTFSGNHADIDGGALHNFGPGGESSPTLTGVTFRGNYALDDGGAIFNNGASGGDSSPSLTNVTFQDNGAGDNGGAMYNTGNSGQSSPVLRSVSFSGNSANNNGGAMYNTGVVAGVSNPSLTNVILWDDAAASGPEMYDADASPTIGYSIVEGGEGGIFDVPSDPYTSGPGNLSSNPYLGNLADNTGWTPTMALLGPSAALDIGLGGASCPGTDQRGITRPQATGCDRGAYEKIPFVPSDFDGDRISDPAKFDTGTQTVWWLRSSDAAWDGEYMGPGTYVRRSDFDGDGRSDPGKFDATNSLWYVRSSHDVWASTYLGPGTYTFVAGSDFDGDGKTDPSHFNSSINALWTLASNDGAWIGLYTGPGTYEMVSGSDFDGDHMTDPAHFSSSTNVLWWRGSDSGTWFGEYLGPGTYGYIEASDFDGDGITDPATFSNSTNVLWYLPSSTGVWVGLWMGGGTLSYVTAVDFDGDGLTDPAAFDAGTQTIWYYASDTLTWQSHYMGAGTYHIVN